MLFSESAPYKVVEHTIILVLPCTVVSVKVDMLLTETVALKEVVKTTHHSVCTLTTISSFVSQVIDLAGKSFTVHPKNCALPRCKKVDGAGLQWVGWIVDLLCIVE